MNQQEPQAELLLNLVPANGNAIGNQALRDKFIASATATGLAADEVLFESLRASLIEQGVLIKGKGRGGSVHRAVSDLAAFDLAAPENDREATTPRKPAARKSPAPAAPEEPQVIAYRHADRRVNNPEVGMVTPDSDPESGKTRWQHTPHLYDPHLDPTLQFDSGRAGIENLIDDALAGCPQPGAWRTGVETLISDFLQAPHRDQPEALRTLIFAALDAWRGEDQQEALRLALEELKRLQTPYLNWSGKAEHTSFEVDTVSLHVHERIDPASILRAVQKRMKDGGKKDGPSQGDFFRAWFEEPLPLARAVEFYKHDRGWMNRLVAGDSLLVMNSLLKKEGMAGQVQMIYIDPPYGIKYGSNFQPFTNKRDVKDRKDEDLTQEPEMIKAFRDTWELGIHSYLTYLRDRLLLARELLHETGSVFVQISDENLHHVREVMDEVFGTDNFAGLITVAKTSSATSELLAGVSDYVVWYARDISRVKYHQLFQQKEVGGAGASQYSSLRYPDGLRKRVSDPEQALSQSPAGTRVYRLDNMTSQRPPGDFPVDFFGRMIRPTSGYWKTGEAGMQLLAKSGRLDLVGNTLCYVRYLDDFPVYPYSNLWTDTVTSGFGDKKVYVVQTNSSIVERCLLMTTDPGDLVLDPTCGSGTTAFVAEKWGRRWITCDTSRVAVTLARQRLMTASFDYFELRYPHEGIKGGFFYKTVPHVTLKSIANNPEIDEIYERMHPEIEAALADLDAALVTLVGRVSPTGRNPTNDANSTGNVGLRDKAANPTYENPLREWEVPFDFPADWPKSARAPFDAFHAARQAMQRQMDASIAAHADQETLYDQPEKAKNKLRITGPFTVEAVPFPSVKALDSLTPGPSDKAPTLRYPGGRGEMEADASIARSGESARQHQWRDELLKTGIRGVNAKAGGQMFKFADLETLPDTIYLHAVGNLDSGERVVVSFGPEHAALEQRQVEMALREAEKIRPTPRFIVFAAFTFDPEAAKDIDEMKWPGVTLLKAQMNTDLLTEDLKKARGNNQSFWLMGQPDVEARKLPSPPAPLPPAGEGRDWYEVEVNGFDYFDTAKGELVSGGKNKIAVWSLDTDYDERSLFPRQVFFPMAGKGEGWEKLKKDIRAELDEHLLEQFKGTVSLPFQAGENRKVAVKIVDDRGIESLKVISLN